jgi:uncharacterized integral membrane protein
VIGLVLATAVVLFVAQNTTAVPLEFLWTDFHTSPAVLVLVTGLLAVVASVVVGAWVRHRRRRQLAEREELAHLRNTTTPEQSVPSSPVPNNPPVTK